jgi:hypothetical protein
VPSAALDRWPADSVSSLRRGRRHLPGGPDPNGSAGTSGESAAGTSLRVDPDLADAYFLADHPGWTWFDLEEAPEDLVDTMREIRNARIAAEAQRPRRR